ncbi:MAG: mechanosensitive ion channel [Lachnospiraceae bacterium]|nr:mechanosensitive ion channel [Lachnospiraceae bacterium]
MILSEFEKVDSNVFEAYMDKIAGWFLDKLLQIAIMLIFLFIAFKIVKFILKLIKRSFDRTKLDKSVSGFLISLIRAVIYAVIIIMAASIVGIQVTSLVTILGTTGLTIGFALQGSLSNFAGGVLILILKPFKVGDYIIENDKKCEGTVESIDIFYTKIRTFDNRQIVIPNGSITNNSLINLTTNKDRILDLSIGISYDQDIKEAKEILKGVMETSKYSIKDKDINVFVSSFDDSSINLGARCWVDSNDYWNAKWEIIESIKYSFDEHEIEIPYNKLDVNLKQQ